MADGCKFTFSSGIRKDMEPSHRPETSNCEREYDNAEDCFAVAVVEDSTSHFKRTK